MSILQRTSNMLISSLIQDMRCLDKIVNNSLQDINVMELHSWLHPHKKFSDTIPEHSEQYYHNLSYVGCLEILIDSVLGCRLYILLSLINNKMDTVKLRGNVYQPKNVTLGRCVQRFCELYAVEEVEVKSTLDTTTNLVINKEVQTDFNYSDSCKSCTQTTDFLKDITSYIATNFDTSLTKIHRDSINKNIFNMTKYGITMKLTNSLKEDYHNLTIELKNSRQETRNLTESISDLKLDFSRKEKIIEEMMSEKHLYHEEMAKHLAELASAESQIITLEKEKSSLQKNREIIAELRQQIDMLEEKKRDEHKNFEMQINDYKNKLDTQNCNVNSLKAGFNQLKVKFDYLYGKNSKMCQMNFKLETNLENIISSIEFMNKLTDNINKIVINNTESITQSQGRIEELQNCVREQTNSVDKISTKYKEFVDLYKKDRTSIKEEGSEIQGNPVLDLSKQINENEAAIEKLQLQNKKFRIIIQAYQNKT